MNGGSYAAVLATTWGLFFGIPTTLLAYVLVAFPPIGDQSPRWFAMTILILGFSAICSFAFPLPNGRCFLAVSALFFVSVVGYLVASNCYLVTMSPNEKGEVESVIRGNLRPEFAGKEDEQVLEGVGTSDKALSQIYIGHSVGLHQMFMYLPYISMFVSLELLCGFAANKALAQAGGSSTT